MLDINLIRNYPDYVKKALNKRMDNVDFTELLKWDKEKRNFIQRADKLKAEKNKVSSEIPRLKKQGIDTSESINRMKKVSGEIKELNDQISELSIKIQKFLEELPNIPDHDVIAGGEENNSVIRSWSKQPQFSFNPKNHIDLASSLGLIDYERGVKMGGNGFWLYKGNGALLEWGLLNFFIEQHLNNGYCFVLPPHLLTNQCGYTAGQFPKFSEDVYHIESETDSNSTHFLLPTSETALINYHRNETLSENELPKKYFSYTPCYRKEAGSYRSSERGMIRGHQFNKVEIFQFTKPENSDQALDELVNVAENLVQKLGLHYRISKLAANDCGASMAKTYDVEVWIPSMNVYKEVSSASNARDYQARRGNIKFKREETGKNEYINSLNASGLATSRLYPAMLEQLQQGDGSIKVPEVLKKWLPQDYLK